MTEMDLARRLEDLADKAANCQSCALAKTRTNVVFGAGDPQAAIMFIGEAPGFHEDRQGQPFVGNAGRLLETLLREAGLVRDSVYIANVLKCRPPDNRDPHPEEIAACSHFLDEQIDIVDPAVICTLGNFATRLLLKRQVGITRLRGQQFPFRGGRVLIPTYHPAALLRGGRGNLMAEARKDFAMVSELATAREGKVEPEDELDPTQLGLF